MTAIRFNSAFVLAVLALVAAATNAAPVPLDGTDASTLEARAPLKGKFMKDAGSQAVGGLAGSIPMFAMMNMGRRDGEEALEARSPLKGKFMKDAGSQAVGGLAGSIPMFAMMNMGRRDEDEALEARSPLKGKFMKDAGSQAVGGLAGSIPMFAMMNMGRRDEDEALEARSPLKGKFMKDAGSQAVGGLAGSIPMFAMMNMGRRDVEETGHIDQLTARGISSFFKPKPKAGGAPKEGAGVTGTPAAGLPEQRPGFLHEAGTQAIGGVAGSLPWLLPPMGGSSQRRGLFGGKGDKKDDDTSSTGFAHQAGTAAIGSAAGSIPFMMMASQQQQQQPAARALFGGKGDKKDDGTDSPGFGHKAGVAAVSSAAGSLPFLMMASQQPSARGVETSADWEDENGEHLDRRLIGAAAGTLMRGGASIMGKVGGKVGGSAGLKSFGGDIAGGLAGSAPMMFNNKQRSIDEHLDRRLVGAAAGALMRGGASVAGKVGGKVGGSAGLKSFGGDVAGGLAGSAPMMFNNKQ